MIFGSTTRCLRWLPEIRAASEASGTPAHIIAGVMRLESNGNPNIISPAGARGQMQIMPINLVAMGMPEHLWHDPATNVMAGGQFLASRAAEQGSWEGAVGAYFGFGCDVFGTCTEVYISVAMGWAYYYLPAIGTRSIRGSRCCRPIGCPADRTVRRGRPPKVARPRPDDETPTPTTAPPHPRQLTATERSPDRTGELADAEPTGHRQKFRQRNRPKFRPVPTEPTPIPTDDPTEIPTEIPTEVPTEIPTEPPVEEPPPAEETTLPA